MTKTIKIQDPYTRLKFYLDVVTSVSAHIPEKTKLFVVHVVRLNQEFEWKSREMKKALKKLTNEKQRSYTEVNRLFRDATESKYLNEDGYPEIYNQILNGTMNKIEFRWE